MKKWLILAVMTSSFGMSMTYPHHAQAEKPVKIAAKKTALQPYFVMIKASWCPACKHINPALKKVEKAYGKKAKFVTFDVSDKKSQKKAATQAKKLGLDKFFKKFKSRTATVAIVHPKTKKVLKIFQAERKSEVYTKALDKALKKI